jgi:hypothetical protein
VLRKPLSLKWLDRFNSENPTSTVESAITELAVRLMDAYTKKQSELAEQVRTETNQLKERHLAEMGAYSPL